MILVIGTQGRGGILSVVDAIEGSALTRQWPMQRVPSHDSGGMLARLGLAASAGLKIVWAGLTRSASLLHLHSAMRGSFWRKAMYLRLGHLVGLPSVFHLHGSEMKVFYAAQGKLGRRLIAGTFARADRVVVLSESWRQFVADMAPAAKVEVVFNFVNMPPGVVASPRAPGEPLRIAFLGLIGERKGIFDLLLAIQRVQRSRPGRVQLLVGGNGEVDRLKAAVGDLKLEDCVQVLGWIDAGARQQLLRSAHALALPSYNEGLPMALLEAMSFGLPVLTTRVGGIPELVQDGMHGWLVEPGDIEAMVSGLECWIDNDERRVDMGGAARGRVEADFSADAAVRKLDAIYRALVKGGGSDAA